MTTPQPPEAESLLALGAGEMTAGAYLTVKRSLALARAEATADALPPCPACGCRLPGDPDARECVCDAGCDDGPHAPGVNAIIAAARVRMAEDAARWAEESRAGFVADAVGTERRRLAVVIREMWGEPVGAMIATAIERGEL